jgi:hypothetical protein
MHLENTVHVLHEVYLPNPVLIKYDKNIAFNFDINRKNKGQAQIK